jgi:hypothetical protein
MNHVGLGSYFVAHFVGLVVSHFEIVRSVLKVFLPMFLKCQADRLRLGKRLTIGGLVGKLISSVDKVWLIASHFLNHFSFLFISEALLTLFFDGVSLRTSSGELSICAER